MRQATGRHRRAFTLVELLVTLSIIALLIGLLAPALNEARVKARTVACVSTASQNAKAWISYVADHQVFPAPDVPTDPDGRDQIRLMKHSVAGVDWYDDDTREDHMGEVPSAVRPLNPYLGMSDRQTSGGDAVHCAADTMLFDGELDFQTFEARVYRFDAEGNSNYQWAIGSRAPEGPSSALGIYGNSYEANEWIWVTRNAPWGLRADSEREIDAWFTTRNGPEDVSNASRFALLWETFVFRPANNGGWGNGIPGHLIQPHHFRHGNRQSTIAFLDGSAGNFFVEPGDYHSNRYSVWPDPQRSEQYSGYANFGFQRRGTELPPEAEAQLR